MVARVGDVTRIASVIALTSGRAICARCERFHAVSGGELHAVEPELQHLPVCDVCAREDDPDGYAVMMSLLGLEER